MTFVSVLAAPPLGEGSIASLVGQAGPVARLVLLILLGFSVISWAIIFQKWRLFSQYAAQGRRFRQYYDSTDNFAAIYAAARKMTRCYLARLFAVGYEILREQQLLYERAGSLASAAGSGRIPQMGFEHVHQGLVRQTAVEVGFMERALTFLATTGSATPFIGLFGTVWGIMTAFQGMGTRASASIAVVAPGIAEALIATAAGLAAAIPAVIAYNYFVNRVKYSAADMDTFIYDFSGLVRRNFVED